MTTGGAAFRETQAAARSRAAKSGGNAPTQEYLIRHTLESFLDRLARTTHHGQFDPPRRVRRLCYLSASSV